MLGIMDGRQQSIVLMGARTMGIVTIGIMFACLHVCMLACLHVGVLACLHVARVHVARVHVARCTLHSQAL